jgi:hypothetical protein
MFNIISNSVVDPDPQGSETFQDPDPLLEGMDPDPDSDPKLDLNLTKNPKN